MERSEPNIYERISAAYEEARIKPPSVDLYRDQREARIGASVVSLTERIDQIRAEVGLTGPSNVRSYLDGELK